MPNACATTKMKLARPKIEAGNYIFHVKVSNDLHTERGIQITESLRSRFYNTSGAAVTLLLPQNELRWA